MVGLLSENAKLIKLADHSTAATSAVTSAALDTQGFGGAWIFSSFGTAAADNTMKLQYSDDDAATDAYSDVAGTSVSAGTSDEDIWIDCKRPAKRYVKAVFARGTSSTLESIWAILYNPTNVPVDNTTSGTITGEAHVQPAEGTA